MQFCINPTVLPNIAIDGFVAFYDRPLSNLYVQPLASISVEDQLNDIPTQLSPTRRSLFVTWILKVTLYRIRIQTTWANRFEREMAKMTKMTNPAHPGEIVRDEVLPGFGVSIAQAAEILKTARPGFNNMLNGKRALSHEMALKIEVAFGVSAEMLTNAQNEYDLAHARAHAATFTAGIERQQTAA